MAPLLIDVQNIFVWYKSNNNPNYKRRDRSSSKKNKVFRLKYHG